MAETPIYLPPRDLAKIEHITGKRDGLFLDKEITTGVLEEFVVGIGRKEADSRVKQIYIYIHCEGGSMWDGLVIAEAMRRTKKPVNTVVIGKAYSGAALVAAAGTPGRRFAWDNSEFMLHEVNLTEPPSPVPVQTSLADLRKLMELYEKENIKWFNTLSSLIGKPLEQIRADVLGGKEFYMNAEEAKAYGLIDHVIPRRQPIARLQ